MVQQNTPPELTQALRYVSRGFKVQDEWADALHNIHFVMVGTTHSGNVGMTARAMKNTAFSKLILVNPPDCGPNTDAFPMASGAYEIVAAAGKFGSLEEALAPMVMSVATSGRLSGKRDFSQTTADLVPQLLEAAGKGPAAVIFGRESSGLTNDEFMLCTHHMVIPTNHTFASMNVAHAAAVVGCELFKQVSIAKGFGQTKRRQASGAVKEAMFKHIEEVLNDSGFLKTPPITMMREIRRIFNSADLDDRDAGIMRGIFRKIGNMVRKSRKETE